MGSVSWSYSGSVSTYGAYDASIRVNYSESYNASTNKTTVSLTSVEYYCNKSFGSSPVYGTVYFGSSSVKTLSGGYTNTASGGSWNTITNSSGSSVSVTHNTSGAASLSIDISDMGASWNGKSFYVYGASAKTVSLTSHTVTLTVNPNGGTWRGSTSSQTFSQAPTSTKTIANPTRDGYIFTGWTKSGGGAINNTTYTFGSSNGTLTAGWADAGSAVTLIAGQNIDSVSGAGTYTSGETVTCTATLGSDPNYSYLFNGWYSESTVVSRDNPYVFTMGNSDISLTAKATRDKISRPAISMITTLDGNTYEVKDAEARDAIEGLGSGIAIQSSEPTGKELAWIDTDEPGTTHEILEMSDFDSGAGHCKMPDGTLIQWGVTEFKSGSTSSYISPIVTSNITLTMPIPFADTNYIVFGSGRYSTGLATSIGFYSATTTSAYVHWWDAAARTFSETTPLIVRWCAIGRWK